MFRAVKPEAKPATGVVVTATRRLSAGMTRVHFRAEDLSAFEGSACTDRFVRLEIPAGDGSNVCRTYTALDPSVAEGTFAIDFVHHGDEGFAGRWAVSASPGDVLTVRGPGGTYAPDPSADWHLLVGDESALPAIRAAIAALPTDAMGYAVIEVPSVEHLQQVDAPAGVEVRWLDATVDPPLDTVVRELPWLLGRVHAFVHGEAEVTMQRIRPYLLRERGVPRGDLSISGYWRRGNNEDSFRTWKRGQAVARHAAYATH
ncbi:siderophore-interacting protein [Nocardioides albus]|uniref:NADPH-dependent ferric siderophore reductase n=1 Tax=Nocardioides albus TaxID=1841 RepID=A0A7W5A5T2_9ACTN|nr:siderophore-interacting protein [Nocardioides albus]MBB3089985.1 NADPH-dependent ferric siderophore reductase [Nocardioides albus]GGU37052.1 siderophore-interacting protein [Nocardioides albus]